MIGIDKAGEIGYSTYKDLKTRNFIFISGKVEKKRSTLRTLSERTVHRLQGGFRKWRRKVALEPGR